MQQTASAILFVVKYKKDMEADSGKGG